MHNEGTANGSPIYEARNPSFGCLLACEGCNPRVDSLCEGLPLPGRHTLDTFLVRQR